MLSSVLKSGIKRTISLVRPISASEGEEGGKSLGHKTGSAVLAKRIVYVSARPGHATAAIIADRLQQCVHLSATIGSSSGDAGLQHIVHSGCRRVRVGNWTRSYTTLISIVVTIITTIIPLIGIARSCCFANLSQLVVNGTIHW
jgi:hypothetical protein